MKNLKHWEKYEVQNPDGSWTNVAELLKEERSKAFEAIAPAVANVIWMARRYADLRRTYAVGMFNEAYDSLRHHLGTFERMEDPDNAPDRIKNYPYATDGSIEFKPRKYSPPKPTE